MDDFDIDGLLAGLGSGNRKAGPGFGAVRELTLDDLLHAQGGGHNSTAPAVKNLRQSHHQLARVLAAGSTNHEASLITGYTSSRISILREDPGFKELLAYYVEQEAANHETARADYAERLHNLGFDTLEELQKRLDEQPELFTNKELLSAMELISDRIGHGKTATLNTNVSHSVDDETLARIRATAGAALGVSISEADHGAILGGGLAGETSLCAIETTWVEGHEGSGAELREENQEDAGE